MIYINSDKRDIDQQIWEKRYRSRGMRKVMSLNPFSGVGAWEKTNDGWLTIPKKLVISSFLRPCLSIRDEATMVPINSQNKIDQKMRFMIYTSPFLVKFSLLIVTFYRYLS